MLNIVYSDGPVYFKKLPFYNFLKMSYQFFSTFGNESRNYDGPILFEEDEFCEQ